MNSGSLDIETEGGKTIAHEFEAKNQHRWIEHPRKIFFSAPDGTAWEIDMGTGVKAIHLYADNTEYPRFEMWLEPEGMNDIPQPGKWPPKHVILKTGDVVRFQVTFKPKPATSGEPLQLTQDNAVFKTSVLPMERFQHESDGKKYFFVKIVKKCNSVFSGKKWTDNNAYGFSLKELGGGDWWLNGMPFHIIDADRDELEGGDIGAALSMMILAGEHRKDFPKRISDIAVGEKAKRLMFLHSAAWMWSPSKTWDDKEKLKMWQYRIHYSDGSTLEIPVVHHLQVEDWYRGNQNLPQAKAAYVEYRGATPFIVWGQTWENPHPEKPIETIDIESCEYGIPVILAITGERP